MHSATGCPAALPSFRSLALRHRLSPAVLLSVQFLIPEPHSYQIWCTICTDYTSFQSKCKRISHIFEILWILIYVS